MADWDPRANGIFLEAAEIDEVEARRAFLDRACRSDDELRRKVEALLKSYEEGGFESAANDS